MTGLIMGTPEYMSPEQCRGDVATYQSDQYALGAVVYAMLTGAPPFTGQHYQVLTSHTTEPPRAILDVRPDCPEELADAVHRMLAKSPADRWPDINDALKAASCRPMLPVDPVRDEIAHLVTLARDVQAKRESAGIRRRGPESEAEERTPTMLRILAMPDRLESGDVVDLRATACFSDGEELESPPVAWESTDPSIASIDPDSGQLVAVGAGSAVITVRSAGIAQSIPVAVSPPARRQSGDHLG